MSAQSVGADDEARASATNGQLQLRRQAAEALLEAAQNVAHGLGLATTGRIVARRWRRQ
jgi:hypothetical protein